MPEVALSLMLLAGSSLLVRTFVTMRQRRSRLSADRLLTLRVPLPARRYPEPARKIAFFRELLDRVGRRARRHRGRAEHRAASVRQHVDCRRRRGHAARAPSR